MTTVAARKTDVFMVPVSLLGEKIAKVVVSFLKILKFIIIAMSVILYTPIKLFVLWNKGYSIKPILFLNGFETKTKRQRLGGSAFAYDFKVKKHYRSFIYFDLFKGGFVVKKPTSSAGFFRDYNEYKFYDNETVVITLWPTLSDLRKAYRIAIKASKLVIEKDAKLARKDAELANIQKLTQELEDLPNGKFKVIESGDPRDASYAYYFKYKDGMYKFVEGISRDVNVFGGQKLSAQELAEKMHQKNLHIYENVWGSGRRNS